MQDLNLNSPQITDAGLVHLKGLTKLEHLDIRGTQITDAGLVHLIGLQLISLTIPDDAKTDLGLKHYLAALKHYHAALEIHHRISLENWRITDAGLGHLKGLRALRSLNLSGAKTKITDAGVADLQKALANCKIYNK